MGFEPTTSAVTGRRSNQLSHQAIIIIILTTTKKETLIFNVSYHNLNEPPGTRTTDNLIKSQVLYHLS